jgi:hypothetical protein
VVPCRESTPPACSEFLAFLEHKSQVRVYVYVVRFSRTPGPFSQGGQTTKRPKSSRLRALHFGSGGALRHSLHASRAVKAAGGRAGGGACGIARVDRFLRPRPLLSRGQLLTLDHFAAPYCPTKGREQLHVSQFPRDFVPSNMARSGTRDSGGRTNPKLFRAQHHYGYIVTLCRVGAVVRRWSGLTTPRPSSAIGRSNLESLGRYWCRQR